MIFARDWSVRNTAIYCEYNFPPSPSVLKLLPKTASGARTDAAEIHSFPDKAGEEKGQEQLHGTDEFQTDSTFYFVVFSYFHGN